MVLKWQNTRIHLYLNESYSWIAVEPILAPNGLKKNPPCINAIYYHDPTTQVFQKPARNQNYIFINIIKRMPM